MNCHIYLRKGAVYIPTLGKMGKGFYRGVEPVAVVSTSNTEALRQALAATIARGNPDVPTLLRREWPPPVLLKYAGVKSSRYVKLVGAGVRRGMQSIRTESTNHGISES